MPGFTTHYLIGQKLKGYIKDERLNQILARNQNAFNAGLQGPDLFFYNIIFVAGPVSRNVGKQMHEHKTGAFFEHFLTLSENLERRKDRETAISYFLGFLCHYTLDTIIHPYVYARCGISDVDENAFAKHTYLESVLDVCILKQEQNLLPSAFHQTSTLKLNKRELRIISDLMNHTIFYLYGISPRYRISYRFMKFGTFVLHDNTGLKRKAALFFEQKVIHSTMAANLIQTDSYKDTIDAFNQTHRCYINPWVPEKRSRQSVFDMIEDSCLVYQHYTNTCAPYLCSLAHNIPDHGQKKLVFSTIGSLSYHSGIPCL